MKDVENMFGWKRMDIVILDDCGKVDVKGMYGWKRMAIKNIGLLERKM